MLITTFSIIILILEIVFLILFCTIGRQNKMIFSKNTALWFIPVFFFLLFLYLIGYIYSKPEWKLLGLLSCISTALKSFTFEIKLDYVELLIIKNIFYATAFYLAYMMAVLTVISTAVGLVKDYLLNAYRVKCRLTQTCDVVVGYNRTSIEYVKKHKETTILWLLDSDSNLIKKLYSEKIAFFKGEFTHQNILKKGFKKHIDYNFIVFNSLELSYQSIINEFKSLKSMQFAVFLHLEVNYDEMEVVRGEYLKDKNLNPNLFISCFSRYELAARRFVLETTLPSFLSSDFFEINCSIKNEKEINVFFLGFGKVNSSLFTMFCENNQLVTTIDNKLASKLVNYYIIDNDINKINSKRINYLINSVSDLDSDLPAPEAPGHLSIINDDLRSEDCIRKIKN